MRSPGTSGISGEERSLASRSPLSRLLSPTETLQIDGGDGEGEPVWFIGDNWRALARLRAGGQPPGATLARFLLPNGDSVSAVQRDDGKPWVPFDLDEAYRNFVTEAWRAKVRSKALTQRQLSAYYLLKPLIPRALQLAGRRLFARRSGLPSFPSWPLEESVDFLLRFYAHCLLLALGTRTANFRWFWPGSHRAALILTHDVESGEGLRLALELADLEEARGFRSSFNIVGSWYPIDYGVVSELRDRGFEIGLHGLRHDRSLFASRDAFVRQLPAVAEAASALGAAGFRSPSTHRVHDWLAELPVLYDCSVPHSDPFEPQPGGCCTIWPYFIGDVVELPYTLPQDHTLLTLLRQRSIDTWLAQADAIERRHGLVQCLSHPDPGYLADPPKRALYVELLDALAERKGLWKPLPRELADWWRRRDRGDPRDPDITLGIMRESDEGPYATLEPPPRQPDRTEQAEGPIVPQPC